MIDVIYFHKFKYPYLILLLVFFSFLALEAGPLHEVYIDISVSIPKEVRKTDFSWITVNEWFNGQVRLIESHSVLQHVKTGIGEEALKGLLFVKRLDAVDVIRVSIHSDDDPHILGETLNKIGTVYLESLRGILGKGKALSEPIETVDTDASRASYENTLADLKAEGVKIENDIKGAQQNLNSLKNEVAPLEAIERDSKKIESEIARVGNTLSPLNEKLANLLSVYTENWPTVVELKQKMEPLETEKARLEDELAVARAAYENIDALRRSIGEAEAVIRDLQNQERAIRIRLADHIKKEPKIEPKIAIDKEETSYGAIITPPTRKILFQAVVRALIGALLGFAIWFAISKFFAKRQSYFELEK
ncbi:MAG: hypothetical protein ABID09_00715 [Candidatus Omnitrophota bacterium]